MIEIARVEPKKIQRKLLTKEQAVEICQKQVQCRQCPLRFFASNFSLCGTDVKALEIMIKDYWNEEIEIKEECL